MKRLFQVIVILLISNQVFGQMVLTAPGVTPKNVCTPGKVYFLMSDKAKTIEPIKSIEERMNKTVTFVKKNPDFKASVAIQSVVNCKGENGKGTHIVDSSKNEKLDKELLDFIDNIKGFQLGKVKGEAVDCWYMWRMEIAAGHITITSH